MFARFYGVLHDDLEWQKRNFQGHGFRGEQHKNATICIVHAILCVNTRSFCPARKSGRMIFIRLVGRDERKQISNSVKLNSIDLQSFHRASKIQ